MASNRSGYNATLWFGATSVVKSTDIRVEINHEPVEVTNLASIWKERVAGIRDWRITGTRNYMSTSFLSLAAAATTSVVVKIKSPSGTTIFSSVGFITRGMGNFPMGMSTEEIEVVSKGTPPVIL